MPAEEREVELLVAEPWFCPNLHIQRMRRLRRRVQACRREADHELIQTFFSCVEEMAGARPDSNA